MLEKKYKFYLSFENAICTDYVTEKFYQILQKDVVPVVFGGGQYSRIAPPNSYIDASQFTGPKQLAKFLKMVAANDTLYAEYLEWKKDYVVAEAGLPQMGRNGFCDLCRKLHRDKRENSQPNLASFWGIRQSCYQPAKKWWNQYEYQYTADEHQTAATVYKKNDYVIQKQIPAKKIKIKY
jgi:alpha-1,3-fucosyltransferase